MKAREIKVNRILQKNKIDLPHGNLQIKFGNQKKSKVMDTNKLEKVTTKNHSNGTEIEKATAYIMVELIEYEDNSVVTKSIMKKSSGTVNAMSFDSGEGLNERSSPFDTFAQIIDGNANIVIDGKSTLLETGQGIIIPAHSLNSFKPNGRFKMLITVIKSGYE
jgi:quercetin dioxygenase-like cupin family protein